MPRTSFGPPAHELHDVDLPGLRPADLLDVVAEHPERRPEARGTGNLDARLDPAVLELAEVPREQARRRELARAVVAALRAVGPQDRDDEVALAVGRGVRRAGGVGLELVVPPAHEADRRAVAEVVPPGRRVRGRAGRAVELVAPGELPRDRARRRGRDGGRARRGGRGRRRRRRGRDRRRCRRRGGRRARSRPTRWTRRRRRRGSRRRAQPVRPGLSVTHRALAGRARLPRSPGAAGTASPGSSRRRRTPRASGTSSRAPRPRARRPRPCARPRGPCRGAA